MENTNLAKEDHLKNFVQNTEIKSNEVAPNNIEHIGPNTKQKVDYIQADSVWMEIPLKELPFGKFYKDGTHISIRPAKTKEIESFSVVNEKNPYDVTNKLNDILMACTQVTFADGSRGTYRDIMDGDRDTIAIIISRATVKRGRKLEKSAFCSCTTEKTEVKIEMIPANYVFRDEDEDLKMFWNPNTKVYECYMYNDALAKLAPPTIGLTQDINNYIFYVTTKSGGKTIPNIAFMQCLPYMKAGLGVKSLSIEALEQEEYNFSQMNDELFMFIENGVDKISFGVKELKGKCPKCEVEVHTPFGFPDGPRSLFVVRDAFKQFARQPVRVHDANASTGV